MLTLNESRELILFTKSDYESIFDSIIEENDIEVSELDDDDIIKLAEHIKYEYRFIWKEM